MLKWMNKQTDTAKR